MTSEDTLIDLSRQGSIDAFSELVLLHQGRVRSYLGRYLTATDAVDDLLQEVFLAAFRTLSTYRDDHGFALWLLGIARHRALTFLRSERHRRARDQDAWATMIADWQVRQIDADDQQLGRRDLERDALTRCLESLPEKSAALMRGHYLEGTTQAALSKDSGLSASAIRMAIMRVRDRLRTCIEQRLKTPDLPS